MTNSSNGMVSNHLELLILKNMENAFQPLFDAKVGSEQKESMKYKAELMKDLIELSALHISALQRD